MNDISRFCVQYIETGQHSRLLLENGFKSKGRKYKKSYNKSLIGGTKPVISVDPRKSRSGFSCSAQFGIVGRNDGSMLIDIAGDTAIELGFRQVTYTDRNGRSSTGFQKNGVLMVIGGSTTYSYSSYSTDLYFQRVK